ALLASAPASRTARAGRASEGTIMAGDRLGLHVHLEKLELHFHLKELELHVYFKELMTLALAAAALVHFGGGAAMGAGRTLERRAFGATAEGEAIDLYTLKNGHGVEATIATLGGIVVSLKVPDKKGTFADVVLGFDTGEGYRQNSPY